MFIVLLKFTDRRSEAASLAPDHMSWLARGFEDGVFLLAGTLRPASGGAILAAGLDRAALERRLGQDPFVAHGIVTTEILEIAPSKLDPRLVVLHA